MSAIIDAEMFDALQDSFERRRVPKRLQKKILEWAETIEMGHALLENVRNGACDISGIDNGEPVFSITEQGKRYVEEKLLPTAGAGG